jgi:hypothetical protein
VKLLQAPLPDNFQYAINVFDYVVVPKSQYGKTVCLQACGSLLVVLTIIGVLTAVKLYNNPRVKRHEVNNIGFNRLLSPKF